MLSFIREVRPLSQAGRVAWLAAIGLVAALLMVAWSPAHAYDSDAAKAESPYFQVASTDPSTDRLPLKSTRVDVRISGVIADVTVTQHYRNEGQRAIEARYVFPGSTAAAVYALNVRLADRLLVAKIREKQQARIEYETAKKEGKTSALLEQHRPNVFEMNVANIMPGDDVAVELRYTELLTPTDARYEFVFPTVVGPRYNSPQGAAAGEKWVAMPFAKNTGGAAAGTRDAAAGNPAFELKVMLDTPIAVREISSSSHEIEVGGVGSVHASAALRAGAKGIANDRDFILSYRLAGDKVETGLMLFRGERENFFLAMVEPPKAPAPAQISPRDYVFVVDISGSMHGYPLDTAKVLLDKLIGSLRPSDTFNVLLFSGSSRTLAPASVPATRANIDTALQMLNQTMGGGGTEVVPALKRVFAMPKPADVSRSIVVVTDGYVTVESEVFQLIRNHLNQANVFAFGIGSDVNRHLIEGMARAGQGEAFVITKPEQAGAQAERFRRMIEGPVLTQVSAHLEGLDAYDVVPAQLPDVLAARPVVVFGKWRGDAAQLANARLVVEGRSAGAAFRAEVQASGRDDASASALRYLWARQRIGALADQEGLDGGSAQKDAITALGLSYNLLTAYTSFVAVDQVVRNSNPALAPTVDQPVPLPAGVSELAIGAEVPSTPEPAFWLALAVVGMVLLGSAWRGARIGRVGALGTRTGRFS